MHEVNNFYIKLVLYTLRHKYTLVKIEKVVFANSTKKNSDQSNLVIKRNRKLIEIKSQTINNIFFNIKIWLTDNSILNYYFF